MASSARLPLQQLQRCGRRLRMVTRVKVCAVVFVEISTVDACVRVESKSPEFAQLAFWMLAADFQKQYAHKTLCCRRAPEYSFANNTSLAERSSADKVLFRCLNSHGRRYGTSPSIPWPEWIYRHRNMSSHAFLKGADVVAVVAALFPR